jgi:hypothetical protein
MMFQYVLAVGTQTPRSSQLYLPSGVTITRLVDLVHGSPDLSVAEMLRSITRDRTDGLRDDCYQVLDLLLRAIVEGRRGLIRFVAERHAEAQHLSTYDPSSAELVRQSVFMQLNTELHRAPNNPPLTRSSEPEEALPAEDVAEYSDHSSDNFYL